jgi:hypothetical protein
MLGPLIDSLVAQFMEVSQQFDPAIYPRLIDEEGSELIIAFEELMMAEGETFEENKQYLADFLKEAADYLYVLHGLKVRIERDKEVGEFDALSEATLQRLMDLHYVTESAMLATDIFPEEAQVKALLEVHRSNMSKLTNGTLVRDEHGKILKGPNYSPADMLPIVEEYLSEGFSF